MFARQANNFHVEIHEDFDFLIKFRFITNYTYLGFFVEGRLVLVN